MKARREQDVCEANGFEPPHFEPGTRVMVVDDKWEPRRSGLVGIVQSGDPYPNDARHPKRSPYVTIVPENYYLGRMFFHHNLLVPFEGESVIGCSVCPGFHWRPGETCPKGYRVRPHPRNPKDSCHE